MHRQPRAIPAPAVAAYPQSWETATLMLSEAPKTSLKQHPLTLQFHLMSCILVWRIVLHLSLIEFFIKV